MKSVLFAALVAASGFAVVAVPAWADEATVLDPVVVTATRTPVPESDVLAQTIVIDRAEIERTQATDVADILSRYAGIEIGRPGGPGQPASLFIRGGNSDYTLVLIDGVRVNNGSDGGAALANINPAMIERIEVVEGPRSALYGPDAIGGVINIITRKPGPAELDANIGGGSFGTVQGGAALRGEGSVDGHAWGASLGAQQQYSEGFPTYTGSSDDRGYRNRSLNGQAQIDLSGVELAARAWDARGDSQYTDSPFGLPPNYDNPGFVSVDENFHDQILVLAASTHLASWWQSDLSFSRSQDKLSQNQSTDFVRTARPELDWHNVLDLGNYNRLSFGALARRDHVDAPSIAEATDNDYGYVQDELNIGRNHAVAAVSYLHDGGFGERFDWNAEYGYDVLRSALGKTTLIGTAGTAFHAPTANDRFGFGGNPDLRPEKALNYEAGLKQELGIHQNLSLRLFRTDVRDLISLQCDANFNCNAINLAHTRSDGAQATWQYVDNRWTARADGILQNSRDRDADMQLLRRARASASAELTRHLGRYDLGAGLFSSGKRPDVSGIDGAPTTDGGYALVSLNAGARLTRDLRLDARLDNAFNHHYQTANGYNQPGTAAYATLRYALPLK